MACRSSNPEMRGALEMERSMASRQRFRLLETGPSDVSLKERQGAEADSSVEAR